MRAARRTSTGFGDDFEVHTALALAYHASGSHEIAREHYDKATELARRAGSTTGSITLELPLLYSGMLFAQTGSAVGRRTSGGPASSWLNAASKATPTTPAFELVSPVSMAFSVTHLRSRGRGSGHSMRISTPTSSIRWRRHMLH